MEKKELNFRINDYFVYGKEGDYQHNEKFLKYLDTLTDLTLFNGVDVDENGNIVFKDGEEKFKSNLDDIKAAIGDRDIKIYCELFAGNKDAEFFEKNGKTIAKNAAAFTTKYDIEGIDIDWEYPKGKSDWDAFNQLVIDLHEELSKVNKKFSLAVAVWNMNFSDEVKNLVDYYNIMIYDHMTDDHDRYHSTFKQTTLAIERLFYQGYEKERLNLGIPYYGREAEDSELELTWPSFCDSKITDEWTNVGFGGTNDAGKPQPAYFNGYAMVRDKVAYAISMDLGGVMGFQMMCDTDVDTGLSLHSAVKEALEDRLTNSPV